MFFFKCKEPRISFSRSGSSVDHIIINHKQIEVVSSAKLLGVVVSDNLVSPINVIKTINVIPTINEIKIDHKCNTNHKCNNFYYSNFIHCTNSDFLIGWFVPRDAGLWRNNLLDVIIVVKRPWCKFNTPHCHYASADSKFDHFCLHCGIQFEW